MPMFSVFKCSAISNMLDTLNSFTDYFFSYNIHDKFPQTMGWFLELPLTFVLHNILIDWLTGVQHFFEHIVSYRYT